MIKIRKFSPEDIEEISKLFYETVRKVNIKNYSREQVKTWAPSKKSGLGWTQSLSENITYVAEKDNRIVGFGDITQEGYIDRLYTHKDYQGRGIATKLLVKLEEEAQSRGITKIYTQSSITAKPFFKAKGYYCEKTQTKYLNGIAFKNYLMKKFLEE